jgi:hypothetical protein
LPKLLWKVGYRHFNVASVFKPSYHDPNRVIVSLNPRTQPAGIIEKAQAFYISNAIQSVSKRCMSPLFPLYRDYVHCHISSIGYQPKISTKYLQSPR